MSIDDPDDEIFDEHHPLCETYADRARVQRELEEDRNRLPTFPDNLIPQLPPKKTWRLLPTSSSSRWVCIDKNSKKTPMLLPPEVHDNWEILVNGTQENGTLVHLLVVGPKGTGKDTLAKLIHAAGPRNNKPCPPPVNCTGFPDGLFSSEVFGCAKGSFTGAQTRAGILREAVGGTVILDEIGVLKLYDQARLLTFLQEGFVQPVGEKAVKVDVRIIATTNEIVDDPNIFRPDLLDRFRVVHLRALRDADPADICRLLQAHIRARTHLTSVSISWLWSLMCHSWPGNAREIERYSTNLGNAGNWSKNSGIREATVLDKWLSETATDFMLVLRPREYRSGNYLQSMALSVLSKFKENYANKQFDHFDLNRFHELANSLKLLVLLSNIKPSYEIPGVHLPNVPLWLLKYPEALPKCYDPMILCTQKGPGNPINLIEFLSEMAKHGLGHSSSVFGEWVREIDDPSLPFDDAWLEWIGQMPDSLPSYGDWVEPKGAPVDVLPDHPTPEAVANSTDVVHAPFKKGKPGPTNRRIPDEKLVIILREACKHFGTPRNSKNAERFLWHQLDTEVGKKIYNTQAALSQRVRNIDNLNWRGEAQTLLKQVFGSIK